MEIRVATADPRTGRPSSTSVAVTMRTPGHDFELAAGFLVTEGILSRRDEVVEITYCRSGSGPQEYNVLEARLRPGTPVDLDRLSRNVFTSSSCGVCGKATLDAVEVSGCAPLPAGDLVLEPHLVATLPDRLLEVQGDFRQTGGLHAAGIFDPTGRCLSAREDVGRHNAVDKVVGEAFLQGGLPLVGRVLVVSGRTSFEIVQKALVAGLSTVVSVGAPSSLAVDLARRFGMTLVGFCRGGHFNVYTGPERVRGGPEAASSGDDAAGRDPSRAQGTGAS